MGGEPRGASRSPHSRLGEPLPAGVSGRGSQLVLRLGVSSDKTEHSFKRVLWTGFGFIEKLQRWFRDFLP